MRVLNPFDSTNDNELQNLLSWADDAGME
jgi:hypothetical protein